MARFSVHILCPACVDLPSSYRLRSHLCVPRETRRSAPYRRRKTSRVQSRWTRREARGPSRRPWRTAWGCWRRRRRARQAPMSRANVPCLHASRRPGMPSRRSPGRPPVVIVMSRQKLVVVSLPAATHLTYHDYVTDVDMTCRSSASTFLNSSMVVLLRAECTVRQSL